MGLKDEEINWMDEDEIEFKTIEEFQWSDGNGQCPACAGLKPGDGWDSDTVGHQKNCPLAKTMERAGIKIIWEHINPMV